MSKRDKIAGAIYGFAIGDAMGATTEFMTEEKIAKRYGKVTDIIGGGWLHLKAGEVTDDTQMTICVMNALMKTIGKGESRDDEVQNFRRWCRLEFINWHASGPKDVGGQCSRAINYLKLGNPIAYKDDRALGNGSLMRAMPCAILNDYTLNSMQGWLTHNNSKCDQIILEYTRILQNYLDGKIYTGKVRSLYDPSGYIVNTFNNAIYWSCEDTFENAIIGAVNHGGDADTIAAIAGSLAGAKFGFSEIPLRWIDQLNLETKIILEKFKNFVFSYLQI